MKILDASQTATKLIKVLDKGNNKYCQKNYEQKDTLKYFWTVTLNFRDSNWTEIQLR